MRQAECRTRSWGAKKFPGHMLGQHVAEYDLAKAGRTDTLIVRQGPGKLVHPGSRNGTRVSRLMLMAARSTFTRMSSGKYSSVSLNIAALAGERPTPAAESGRAISGAAPTT